MPRVAVIGTGGSIATPARHLLDLFEYGQFAKPMPVDQLLATLAPALKDFDVVPVPFHAIDSASADAALWLELNREIDRTLARDPRLDGIVVTHGTSTLEETAYFLNLTVKVPVPIVLTAAQRPPNGLSSDAGLNLVNALRVAASPASRGLGVLVVMNDEVQSAREVAKTSNFRLHAFRTADFGVLGHVEADGTVSVYRRPARRHAPDTEFDVRQLKDLPPVEIAYSYAGASASAVEAFISSGCRGIVFAGMPPGRPSPAQRAALLRAAQSGIVIVQCSRAGSGRVVQRSEDRDAGFVPADNLNAQKARVLAMVALAATTERREITRMFAEY
jgi:L-asparaginase